MSTVRAPARPDAPLVTLARRLRLVVVAGFAVTLPFLSVLERHERLLLAGVVVAYGLLCEGVERAGLSRPGLPVGTVTAAMGLAAIVLVTTLVPEASAPALVAYAAVVALAAAEGGGRLGLTLSVYAGAGILATRLLVSGDDRIDGSSVLACVILLPCVGLVVGSVTARRRRRVAGLARLQEALHLGSAAGMDETLARVTLTVCDALGSSAATVLVAGEGFAERSAAAPGTPTALARRDVALAQRSPLTRALERREIVVVRDVEVGERFSGWLRQSADDLRAGGVESLVAVPLTLGDRTVGVMAAGGSRDISTSEAVLLLADLAGLAAPVIARAQAYEQERATAERVADADRQKSEFLATVSHELRTPLTAVKGFVDVVLLHWERLVPERRQELLAKASANAGEMNRAVGQLLDYTRLEEAAPTASPRVLRLRAQVDRAVDELGSALDHHAVRVRVPKDLSVLADPDALVRVLTNLLANAAKFSPADTGIDVSARADGDQVVVAVRDQGPGVDPRDHDRVFERFYQGPDIELSRRGTGIGLALARQLTELHGGRIWVESKPRRGATFAFTIPVAEAVEAGAS